MAHMTPEFRLLQISDPHLFGPAEAALRGVVTRRSLESVLRHARAHHWNAAAILLTGDLVNDDPEGYAVVRELLGDLGKPVWCLPGNHDDPAIMRRELDLPPFVVGGHHDLGAWRVVMLDSCVPGKSHGQLSAAELARLENALATAGERQVLIGLHHHPLPMGSRWIDKVALRNPEDFYAITDRYAQVRVVVWGHVHDLCAVPAPLGALRDRSGAARLPTPDAASGRCDRNGSGQSGERGCRAVQPAGRRPVIRRGARRQGRARARSSNHRASENTAAPEAARRKSPQ